jgi:isopentenyl diphosphate isomerase/L-lactate dehydrogenase-like FMN-dependent dehydrogenase
MHTNRSAMDGWRLRERVLSGRFPSGLSAKVAGVDLQLPVPLAPTGATGLTDWSGERGAAQAAERCGTRAVLSTAASYTPEEVAAGTEEDHPL